MHGRLLRRNFGAHAKPVPEADSRGAEVQEQLEYLDSRIYRNDRKE